MAIERIIEYKIDENIHDIETDKTFLSYDNVDKFTIDISQIDADFESASAKAFFICYKYSDKKKYTEIKCNLDAENKKISFKIPENVRGHVGLVKSNVYLEFDNGDRLDLVGLTFKMQKSLIDENVNEVADYYYETFVEQTKELVKRLEGYENSVKQASDSAIQSIDLKKEEISHMGDGIDELVSQKMSEIQSVNTNLENYLEEKKAGLTDIENDFKSFSDIKKSNIDTLTNEILTYKSGLDSIVETKQSLIESEMGNFSNNVSTAYNQLIGYKEGREQDIDALKTSFNDYLETTKQSIATDLSSIESYKNEQIGKIKTVSDNSIRQITDYTTQEKTNMDSVVNELRQYGTVKKTEIDGNVEEIERIRDENLDRLKNIKYDIDNFVAQKTNDVTTKTNEFLTFVNDKTQTVTSAYDNIDDFIENKNQEFATYADSKKSSINGYLTEFNTYIDSQKAGFKVVVDEQSALVQQAASDFRKNLNMEKVSFSEDINAIHDYYEGQMNTVKEAFANAKTLLDPIIEEERKKLEEALMGSDSIVGKKISEFNTYVDGKKSEVDEKISSISVEIPQVQEVLTDIENRLNVLQDDVGVNLLQNAVEFPISTSSDFYSGRWRYAGSPRTARNHVYITDPPAELPYEKYGAYQITGIHPPYQSDTECIALDQTRFSPSVKYVISCWARIVQGSEAYVGFAGAINFVGGFEKALNGYMSTRLNSDGSWTKCYALIENTGTANLYLGVLTGTDKTVVQVIHPYLAYRNHLREKKMYPINFVFETISIENPNVTLGGTWEKLGEEQKFGRTVFYWRRIS